MASPIYIYGAATRSGQKTRRVAKSSKDERWQSVDAARFLFKGQCYDAGSAELAKVESRIAEIDRLLTVKPTSKPTTFTDEQIAESSRQECKNFWDALAGDAEFARREIQKRIRNLVLTPIDTPDGQVLDASGDVALLSTADVLVESPMEGIAQHYTGASISLAGIRLDPSMPLAA